MKLFNFINQPNSDVFKAKSVVKVEQLTSFDMIYVYHLLSVGTKLNLEFTEERLTGDIVYIVKFNSFVLGFITLTGLSKLLFSGEIELEATIFNLAKEKYLPLKSLELSVSKKSLKMVS